MAGRLACVSLTARRMENGPPVTSEGLRREPVAEYVMAAAAYGVEILLERVQDPDGSFRPVQFESQPPTSRQTA